MTDPIITPPSWLDRRAGLVRRLDQAGWDQVTAARWDDPAGRTRIRVPLAEDTTGAERLLLKAERTWRDWLAAERKQIDSTLRSLIASGERFTADELWDRLPDKVPAIHRNWLGGVIMRLVEHRVIRCRGHVERPRAAKHSRVVKVWQATARAKAAA